MPPETPSRTRLNRKPFEFRASSSKVARPARHRQLDRKRNASKPEGQTGSGGSRSGAFGDAERVHGRGGGRGAAARVPLAGPRARGAPLRPAHPRLRTLVYGQRRPRAGSALGPGRRRPGAGGARSARAHLRRRAGGPPRDRAEVRDRVPRDPARARRGDPGAGRAAHRAAHRRARVRVRVRRRRRRGARAPRARGRRRRRARRPAGALPGRGALDRGGRGAARRGDVAARTCPTWPRSCSRCSTCTRATCT